MSAIAYIVYALIPAVVYFTLGVGEGRLSLPTTDDLRWLFPNYLFFAAPQLLWLGFVLFFRPKARITHAGFIAASLALVVTHAAFECCIGNANALGWLYYYWPLAFVLVCATAAGMHLVPRQGRTT